MVPKADIVAKGYDLSVNRYRETKHAEVTHAHPREILARMKALEAEIARGIEELEGLV
jgi:type I restriction enzyme M protein